jgi:hypothetical protein
MATPSPLRLAPPRSRPLLLALLGATLLAPLPLLPSPGARAEGEVGTAVEDGGRPWGRLGRAVTVARQAAESRNGGPEQYRTATCMQRADGGDCLMEDGAAGFVFRIPGGPPGW